jgi:L-ascorbate metabolism protein UlaG (beta-lactamase superfamily)
MTKTKIIWLGNASVSVEFNGRIIYFDPWLDDNPVCQIKRSDVRKATAICATHGHT